MGWGRDACRDQFGGGKECDALEKRLGIKLLHRTTRKLSLTNEGRCTLPVACGLWTNCEALKAAF